MSTPLALSIFWFLMMGAMGLFFPFYALYLRENAALSGTEVGLVYAMVPLVSLFAPTLWGRVADRAASRARVLALVVAGSGLGLFLLGTLEGFRELLAGTALFACFSTAVIPLGISVSLTGLGDEGQYLFGRVRVWGTVGFLLLVVACPWLLDAVQDFRGLRPVAGGPSEPGLEIVFFVAGALTLCAAIVPLAIRDAGQLSRRAAAGEWRALFAHRPFRRMLVFGFLSYLCLQGPMNFFPAYVRSRGGGLDEVSGMWLAMLLPEIPLVALAGTGLRRIGARGLLTGGVVAGGLRWTVCAATASLPVIYAMQLLHGPVVAGLLMGSPLYIDAVVPLRLRSTAQGLLAMAAVGLGGITSSVVSGWVLDRFGIEALYALAGASALLLGGAAFMLLPTPAPPEE